MTEPTQTTEWQPIETAPHENNWVVVRYRDGNENFQLLECNGDQTLLVADGAVEWRFPTTTEYEWFIGGIDD